MENKMSVSTYDPRDVIFCEDVTGILGELFDSDLTGIPENAVAHLQAAYDICARYLAKENGYGTVN